MKAARWTRLAGMCALAAVVLQGVALAGQPTDAGLQDHWVLCQLPLLLPDVPAGQLPDLAVIGQLADDPLPSVSAAPTTAHPSRGPPA